MSHYSQCERCQGLMLPEYAFDYRAIFDVMLWYCVQCGNRIDPLILKHRREDNQPYYPRRRERKRREG